MDDLKSDWSEYARWTTTWSYICVHMLCPSLLMASREYSFTRRQCYHYARLSRFIALQPNNAMEHEPRFIYTEACFVKE